MYVKQCTISRDIEARGERLVNASIFLQSKSVSK